MGGLGGVTTSCLSAEEPNGNVGTLWLGRGREGVPYALHRRVLPIMEACLFLLLWWAKGHIPLLLYKLTFITWVAFNTFTFIVQGIGCNT